jgi:hypothetical protein
MRELIKFRNLKERDCATVAERCRVLPLLPFPRFALRVARLRGNTGWRNSKVGQRNLSDVTLNNTRRCVPHMSDSSVDRRDWRQCSSSKVVECQQCSWEYKLQFATEFTTSSHWVIEGVISMTCEETASGNRRFTWNIWSVRLLQFVCRHPLPGND